GSGSPDVWQVCRWAVPAGSSADDMLDAVAERAKTYPHIVVSGTGTMVNGLNGALARRGLSGDAMAHVKGIQSGDQLPAPATDGKATVVICVTDKPAEAVLPNEQFVLDPDTAVSAAEYLRSTAALLRLVQGLLKDPNTIADPLR